MNSLKVLKFIYYLARILALTPIRIDLKTNKVYKPTRWNTVVFIIIRLLFLFATISYFGPAPLAELQQSLKLYSNFNNIIQPIHHSSLTTGAIFLFINWTLCDVQTATHKVLKKFFKVHQTIVKKVSSPSILNSNKFLYLVVSKLIFSSILIVRGAVTAYQHLDFSDKKFLACLAGYALSLAADLMTVICFVGFLAIEVFYEQMYAHLRRLADKLKLLDGQHCSRHIQMKVLCEASDELDECGVILSDIYRTAHSFFSLSQCILFYCIFYNFGYILIQFKETFYEHRNTGIIPWQCFVDVLPNMLNLLIFIYCVDESIQKSRRINLIEFDVICSGMDSRWDQTVEMFLSRQNIEELHIKVFGLFELSKEFAVFLFSGGVTYMFFLIQMDKL